MEQHVLDDVLARRFLLGQLLPEEQGRIEELAFEDPSSFEFLQATKDDLIDDFLCDELSSDEKERFQKYFLAQPGRRQDLRIARELQRYLAREEPPFPVVNNFGSFSPPKVSFIERIRLHPTFALGSAALILTAVAGIMLAPRTLRQSDSPPLRAKQEQSPELPAPTSTSTATPPQTVSSPAHKDNQVKPTPSPLQQAAPVYAIVLTPGGAVRSEDEERTLPLPSGPISLELPLIDDTSYRSYQAVLQTGGKTIRTWPNLHPKELQSGKGIKVNVPVGLLERSRRYRIILNGVSTNRKVRPVHNYYFQVGN